MKIALPKGRLMAETIKVLERAGLELPGYREGARIYHISSDKVPNLLAKILHEKDIPVQLAVGNYDLGICGEDWVNELLTKYPDSDVVKIQEMGYGEGGVFAASYAGGELKSFPDFSLSKTTVRIASEYPNLAESLAGKLRLRSFKIYPLWGAAESYPPETADLVLLLKKSEGDVPECGLRPLGKVSGVRAFLIANRKSLESTDMGAVLSAMAGGLPDGETISGERKVAQARVFTPWGKVSEDVVRLALPDGHQQAHVCRILSAAGVKISDYPSETGNYRPVSSLEGVFIKVIRPQDMPVQVANGNFDLAITGRDWLSDHLYQFPGSPVKELLDLKYGRVRIVVAVSESLPVNDIQGLRSYCSAKEMKVRIASEYVNISDRYARVSRLGMYRVIPSWGTTEAFIPEDADLLIENTETGKTLALNNLKIIDTLFESTACLIGTSADIPNTTKRKRIESITALLRKALEAL